MNISSRLRNAYLCYLLALQQFIEYLHAMPYLYYSLALPKSFSFVKNRCNVCVAH